MWGQLAGRISKIGDVVAPALSNDEDDDEEDEDYEDEGEEDEEDEGEYEEEGEDEEDDEEGKPVVGFVGFLTRALDGAKHSSTPSKSQQQDSLQAIQQHQYVEDQNEEDEEEEDVIDLDQQPTKQNSLFPPQQQHHQHDHQSSALSNSDEDLVLVPATDEVSASVAVSKLPVKPTSYAESSALSEDKRMEDMIVSQPFTTAKEPERQSQQRVSDSSKPSSANMAQKPKSSTAGINQQQKEDQSKPPAVKRLVVPSVHTVQKQASVSASNQAPPLQTPSVDQSPPGNNDSRQPEGATHKIVTSSTALPAQDSRSQPPQQNQGRPIAIPTKIQSDAEKEQPKILTKDQPTSDSSNVQRDAAAGNAKPLRGLSHENKVEDHTTSSNITNGVTRQLPHKIKSPAAEVSEKEVASTESANTKTQSALQQTANEKPSSAITAAERDSKGLGFPGTKATQTSPRKEISSGESTKQDVELQSNAPKMAPAATIDNGHNLSDELSRWQAHCQELESRLQETQEKLLRSEQQVREKEQQSEQQRQELMIKFQEKEVRLLEASNEDHQQELEQMRQDAELLCHSLQQQMEQERKMALQQQQQLSRLLSEAESRVESAEESKKNAVSKVQADLNQVQQRQKRSIQMAEDKLAQALAKLDERDEEIKKLKTTVSSLQSKMSQHQEGAQEAEEEMDELHSENETLRQHVQVLQEECTSLRAHVEELEADAEKYSGLEMELKKMKEAYERERALTHSAAQNLESNHAQAESERDAAMAEMQNLQQQLAAALADVNVSRSDTERIMMANANLQNALEAFQSEREAEMALLEDQRRAAQEATAAAHAAALDAMRESNEAKMKEVSIAADKAIRNIMDEVNQLERRVEGYRKENVQLRRSLDEAIHQLQMNQEDVIDRTLMKNVLLEWFVMKGRKEKRQVLEMMASLLHFTEDEKEKIHIIAGIGALSKVVGAVAAPLPAAATDHLDGDTVSEKWVNFLLAETDDGNASTET